MDEVTATYIDGKKRGMPEAHAKILQHVGHISGYELNGKKGRAYQTRHLEASSPSVPLAPVAPQYVIKVDGQDLVLDEIEQEALHDLAAKLEVKVHPMTGAPKMRIALTAAMAEREQNPPKEGNDEQPQKMDQQQEQQDQSQDNAA